MLIPRVHLYDAQTNELTTTDGRAVKAPAKLVSYPDNRRLRARIRGWAISRGYIKAEDEIAYLQIL